MGGLVHRRDRGRENGLVTMFCESVRYFEIQLFDLDTVKGVKMGGIRKESGEKQFRF